MPIDATSRTDRAAWVRIDCIYCFQLGRDAKRCLLGELVDNWGWNIALRAEVVEREGVKVFEGTGTLTSATGDDAGTDTPKAE